MGREGRRCSLVWTNRKGEQERVLTRATREEHHVKRESGPCRVLREEGVAKYEDGCSTFLQNTLKTAMRKNRKQHNLNLHHSGNLK
jgi:hypothetical protein